eukprot:1879410-Pleurochrysis_carterae.AAC.1
MAWQELLPAHETTARIKPRVLAMRKAEPQPPVGAEPPLGKRVQRRRAQAAPPTPTEQRAPRLAAARFRSPPAEHSLLSTPTRPQSRTERPELKRAEAPGSDRTRTDLTNMVRRAHQRELTSQRVILGSARHRHAPVHEASALAALNKKPAAPHVPAATARARASHLLQALHARRSELRHAPAPVTRCPPRTQSSPEAAVPRSHARLQNETVRIAAAKGVKVQGGQGLGATRAAPTEPSMLGLTTLLQT